MYIRTKDKIYEVTNNKYGVIEENGVFKIHCENMGHHWYSELEVIKQSENLEELCDEFVYVSKQNEDYEKIEMPIIAITRNLTSLIKIANFTNSVVLGAIWTSKGLIYVAKMNSDGKLELI